MREMLLQSGTTPSTLYFSTILALKTCVNLLSMEPDSIFFSLFLSLSLSSCDMSPTNVAKVIQVCNALVANNITSYIYN
jgi:hypothetical protein